MNSQDTKQSCQLIGLVGIIVQLALGALSFSVLIYKRYNQKPKRAWKIWAMDTSKQGVSQLLAHIINVIISIQLSTNIESDACIWYLTTNVLDNTLGVFLCLGALSLVERHIFQPKYTRYKSGNYYTMLIEYAQQKSFANSSVIEGQNYIRSLEISKRKIRYAISYLDWTVQFVVWNVIVVISKTLLFYTEMGLSTPIIKVSVFLIGWIQPYQTLELILVVIIVPVIMNGLAFWIQDNFLMKKDMTPVSSQSNSIVVSHKDQKGSQETTGQEECNKSNNINKTQMVQPLL